RLFVSKIGFQCECMRRRAARENLNDSAQSRVAVEIGAAPFNDLYTIDIHLRNATPIDPTAEGIVQGIAVQQHKRATRAVCAQPAQRDSLGSRICGETARSSKQAETGNLSQLIVDSS